MSRHSSITISSDRLIPPRLMREGEQAVVKIGDEEIPFIIETTQQVLDSGVFVRRAQAQGIFPKDDRICVWCGKPKHS